METDLVRRVDFSSWESLGISLDSDDKEFLENLEKMSKALIPKHDREYSLIGTTPYQKQWGEKYE